MKNCISVLYLTGFALVFAIAAIAADDPTLTFKFKDPINIPKAYQTEPSGVNDAGVLVGTYWDNSSQFHGFILAGKKLTRLDDPKASKDTTSASGVNSNPRSVFVVGAYTSSKTAHSVGFVYDAAKKTYTDIPGPRGAMNVYGVARNDSGVIVGQYTDSSNVGHSFVLIGKTYTILNVPQAKATYALGMNNRNKVVLTWESATSFESSLYDIKTKKYKTINYPNSQDSNATGISDAGDVVYDWYNGSWHGGLQHAGKFYQFDVPGSAYTAPGGINNKGEITGWYGTNSNGPYSGFTATYK